MVLQSTRVIIDKEKVQLKIGDDTVVYEADINSFEKESGVTIHNIIFPDIEAYYIQLKDISETFGCSNIFNNLALKLEKNYENTLLVIDFEGVTEVVNSFFDSYTKFLLTSKNKIITINMNTAISNQFSYFIKENIKENISEVEE